MRVVHEHLPARVAVKHVLETVDQTYRSYVLYVYYCRTYYKAVRREEREGGGRVLCMRYDEARPLRTGLITTLLWTKGSQIVCEEAGGGDRGHSRRKRENVECVPVREKCRVEVREE